MHVEFKNRNGTSNSTDNWNHLKMIKKISEQQTSKARHQELKGTAEMGSAQVLPKLLM